VEKIITVNRKAYYRFHILESLEAGLVLTGTEIKSIREGRVSLRDAYAQTKDGEVWLLGMHIARYAAAGPFNHDPTRPRKLLLHRYQIDRLIGQLSAKGLTLVPLKLYLKGGKAKVEMGLAKGKKLYDKRRALKEKEVEREIKRAIKWHKQRGDKFGSPPTSP